MGLRRSTLTGIAALTLVVGLMLGAAMHANGQTAPGLGTASSYAVLGGSTVTNTGPTTADGNVGVWPGTAVTGFPPGIVNGTIHRGDANARLAQGDVTTAYNALAAQSCTDNLTGQDLGGLTLTEGVYCFSSSAQLTGTLTLDAQGHADAVFIFKMGSTLTTASNSSVVMINGGTDCNVFWRVGSSATIGTNTTFMGNILALASITLDTGASVSGRALARSAAVTMDSNNVGFSACAVPTATPSQTAVSSPTSTNTPMPTNTPIPTNTAIPKNTPAGTPMPTNTAMPATTATATPVSPASTSSPVPTATPVPMVAPILWTPTPVPMVTPIPWTPAPVSTQVPITSALPTPTPAPTEVPRPPRSPTEVPHPPRSLPNTGTGGYLDAGE